MTRRGMAFAALALAISATTVVATSEAYDPLTWSSLDCGGVAFVTADGYRLGATIGQPDAGTLTAGDYTLRGGFWSGGPAALVGVEQATGPTIRFRFYPIAPNPVRGGSRLAFDLPRASRATFAIFDIAGRVVRRWDYGWLPAGHQERPWDAVDDRGSPIPSGVYLMRLDTDRERGVHKVLVIR
jgi:hypothetical protein